MTESIAMLATGAVQGAFPGGSGEPAAGPNAIAVLSTTFGVAVPVDPVSGLTTGMRRYDAVTIVKQVDATSPQFLAALVNNEMMTSIDLQYFDNATGLPTLHYRLLLDNARILGVRQSSTSGGNGISEEIDVRFGSITATDGVSSMTDVV